MSSNGGRVLTLDVADCIVAATALEFGTRLLTRNVRHYPMLEGLRPAY